MSDNQEMQFADPAWQPAVTHELDNEPGASTPQPLWSPAPGTATPGSTPQPSSETAYDYSQGYRAQTSYTPGYSAPPQDQQQPPLQGQQPSQGWPTGQRRMPRWGWWLIGALLLGSTFGPGMWFTGPFGFIVLMFLVFVGWLLYTRRLRVNLAGEKQQAETHTFAVDAFPTITVANKAGSIRLHAGQEGVVNITTSRRGYLFYQRWDDEAQVWYNQDKAANTVAARVDSWKPFGKTAIDFDITVPPQATLELVTNAGNVSVQNVAGRMKLRSDAGTIQATGVTLQGKSLLKTNAGTITFVGSLAPTGTYELATDLGTIDATLSADSSFELEAKTDLGTLSSNLPLVQRRRTKLSGQVGVGPYPKLKVKTDLGTVRVNRR